MQYPIPLQTKVFGVMPMVIIGIENVIMLRCNSIDIPEKTGWIRIPKYKTNSKITLSDKYRLLKHDLVVKLIQGDQLVIFTV